jgi:hypothetical protein
MASEDPTILRDKLSTNDIVDLYKTYLYVLACSYSNDKMRS